MSKSKEEEKAYYRINEPDVKEEDEDTEMTTGKKRSKKKFYVILGCVIFVAVAVGILLLVLFLVGKGRRLPSGYNGFVQKESANLRYAYFANILREKEVKPPIIFDNDTNPEFTNVDFHVCMISQRTYRLSYRPNEEHLDGKDRWTVPDYLLESNECDPTLRLSFGEFEVEEAPFGFSLKNPTHRNTFWLSTKDRNLLLSDKYMEVGFEIHSQEVFGWGERTRNFLLDEGEYTIWPTGIKKGVDPGQLGYNTYGDHPFVLARLKDKTFIGLFLKNSNAKVLKYTKETQGRSIINFRTTGGILDVFAFMGDTPEQVIQEYHRAIGLPKLPPLWAFGFQQGSTSYTSSDKAMESVRKYKEAGIPLETLFVDENYMKAYLPFTVDSDNWNMKSMVNELHKNSQKVYMSMHACIPVYDNHGNIYSYFTQGKKVFIRSANQTTSFGGDVLIGEFFDQKCAYVDYHHAEAYNFLSKGLTNLWKEFKYDGVQFNYNEIYQDCDGECPLDDPVDPDEVSGRFDDLPFNPLGEANGKSLESNTISLDSKIEAFLEAREDASISFNNQGLYGTLQSKTASLFFEFGMGSPLQGKRSFVLSRSTFPGAGTKVGHWLGENKNSFEDMKHSISGILNFNLFGIPLTGADICGNTGYDNEEICARWYQLATVYPLARSYYDGEFGTKEAWAFKGQYLEGAKNALNLRLSLLRYFYTIFFEMSQNGGTFWRPLFFEFPDDDEAVKDIEHTFMVGKAIKFTPILQSFDKEHKVMSYFPSNSRFIDIITFEIIEVKGKGKKVPLEPRWDFPLIHLREGSVIPYQKFGQSMTTDELVSEHYTQLLIFPDRHLNAEGTLYVDRDGVSLREVYTHTYEYYKITFSDKMLRIALVDGYDASGKLDMNQIIDNITIVDAAMYNDTNFACMFDENMDPVPIDAVYNSEIETLSFVPKEGGKTIEIRSTRGIQFGNSDRDESFCNPHYVISNIAVDEEGEYANKRVNVSIEATHVDMTSFVAHFYLLKDNLINVDFVPLIEPKPFEIPSEVLNKTLYPDRVSSATENIMSFINLPEVGEDFYFEIHTKDEPKDLLYSTKGQPLVYTRYYKSMGAHVYGNRKMFGIGQRLGEFWRNSGTYAVWNRGAEHEFEDGINPGKNLYGSHPVYFAQRKKGNQWIGVYEHNSGPQEFVVAHDGYGIDITNIKTTGRTNMFFMLNDEIENVITNYYELVGKPALPPRWAFGWHQSRFGYNTTQALREVHQGYKDNELPLDGLWSSVDVLKDFRSFTVDEENFEGIKDFINEIKEQGVRYVPIIQSGISAGNSEAYFEGIKKDVFMMAPGEEHKPLIGRSTAGDVVYVDFMYHGAIGYWLDQMKKLDEELPFDGVWLDMNEITSECDGYCYRDQRAENPIDNRLFYWPGGRDLEKGTVSIDVEHEFGDKELDTHSLYGFWQTFMSHIYFNDQGKRPMVISRSTFAGSGKYGGHWLGENESWYRHMKQSIDNILLFNMFGIPFVGDNVCGFKHDAGIETCTRWYKVAVIYPFARNHNDFGTDPQEPYIERFDYVIDRTLNVTASQVMRKAMLTRYGLHNYMYTQYHKASKDGKVPLKPLFFNYPDEPYSYDYTSNGILVGDAVLASLDTTIGGRQYYYFPGRGEIWCPIWNKTKYECIQGGSRTLAKIPVDEIWLHLRAGHAIPLQLSDSDQFDEITGLRSLDDLQNYYTDIGLLLDSNNEAHGDVRFDDGETTDLDHYDEIKIHAQGEIPWVGKNKLNIEFEVTHTGAGEMTNSQKLGEILIYNAKKLGLVLKTEGELVDVNSHVFSLLVSYDKKMDLTRIQYVSEEAIPLKNVQRIHLTEPY